MYWSSHSFWFSFTDFEVRTTVCRIFNVTMEMLWAFLWMVTLECHVRVSSHCSMVTLQVRLLHVVVTLFHKIYSLFIHINIVGEPKRQDPKAFWEVSLRNFQPLHNSTIKKTSKINSWGFIPCFYCTDNCEVMSNFWGIESYPHDLAVLLCSCEALKSDNVN